MKITSTTMPIQVLAKQATKSKDGQSTYYKLTVLQGAEAGQLSCSESVFNSVKEGEKTAFAVEYNSEYKSLKLVSVVPPAK